MKVVVGYDRFLRVGDFFIGAPSIRHRLKVVTVILSTFLSGTRPLIIFNVTIEWCRLFGASAEFSIFISSAATSASARVPLP